MDYLFYADCKNSFNRHNFLFEHCVLASLNQHKDYIDPANVEFLCKQKFNYNFEFYKILCCGDEPLDYAKHLSLLKVNWLKALKKLEPKKKKFSACSKLKRFKRGVDSEISLRLLRYIQHMRTDPLPGLLPRRNWIFGGNTVARGVSTDGYDTIFTSGGRRLSSLNIIKVSKDGRLEDAEVEMLQNDEPILEISVNCDENSNLVCTRQQHYINVHVVDGFSPVRFFRKKLSPNYFFTSIGLKEDTLAFSKNTGTVVLFNVAANKKIWEKTHVRRTGDCWAESVWNLVHWLDGELWISNKMILVQLDGHIIVYEWDLSKAVEPCEEIRNIIESHQNPRTPYICTTHSLLQVDLRNKEILKKWAHMLSKPPDFGGVVKISEGEEFVVLQSCDAEEAVAVVNSPEAALLPPRLIPSPADTFRKAKQNLICLDPIVGNRPRYSVIGAAVLPFDGGLHQITQNAGGDLFIRKIKKGLNTSIEEEEEDAFLSWQEYEEKCRRLPLHVSPPFSDVIDATNVFNQLKGPVDPPFEKPRREGKVRWNSMQQLRANDLPLYTDFLAGKVVEVWDVNRLYQGAYRPEEIELSDSEGEQEEAVGKVRGWLEDQDDLF